MRPNYCQEILAKNLNHNLVFFLDEIKIFSYIVIRDEIEIGFLYISCFETRPRICFINISDFEKGTRNKKLILKTKQEFSMQILARILANVWTDCTPSPRWTWCPVPPADYLQFAFVWSPKH